MLPNFLCIGAQRAGTTWLNQVLSTHPQVWTPPVKELHYFNFKSIAPSILAHAHQPLMRYRARVLLYRMLREARRGQDIRWYLRYFFLPRSDSWYRSLFRPQQGQIAGEATPEYSILDASAVAEMYRLMPDLKIILLLRDPIERTWSQANQKYRQIINKGAHTDEAVLHTFMQEEHPHQRSSYCDILQVWESIYPPQQIFIGFFEQIAENPVGLLHDICAFLEIDNPEPDLYSPIVHQRVNPGAEKKPSAHWGRYLAQRYYQQIESLHDRFDNASTKKWLTNAQNYLNLLFSIVISSTQLALYIEL